MRFVRSKEDFKNVYEFRNESMAAMRIEIGVALEATDALIDDQSLDWLVRWHNRKLDEMLRTMTARVRAVKMKVVQK